MTELREKLNNIVEDYNACKMLAKGVGNPSAYEGTTATAEDIAKGKTAYSNGSFIEGTSENITNNAGLHPVLVPGNTNGPNNLGLLISKIPADAVISGTNAQYMFFGCKYLTEMPLLDTSALTSMDGMFHGCSGISEFPQFDTSNVTNASRIFQLCSSLVKPPMLDFSKATQMIGIFHTCANLVEVPVYNTSKVTDFFGAFASCTSLVSAPAWDLSSATNVRVMFHQCGARLVNVPVYNLPNATDMYSMFGYCSGLSDESLNNIMAACITATKCSDKRLSNIGLSNTQRERCKSLSNYEALIAAGWTV